MTVKSFTGECGWIWGHVPDLVNIDSSIGN